MSIKDNIGVVEDYREDFGLLLHIKELAQHLHYKTTQQRRFGNSDHDMEIFLEEIIENADFAILHLVDDFANNELLDDDEETQPPKLGYAFTWLKKLNSATNDGDREELLKGWLAEITRKKQEENSTETEPTDD